MKPLLQLVLCLVILVATPGCIPILIHSAVQANSMETAAYSGYLDTMRRTNTQREVAGLPLEPVLTREAWKKTLDLPPKPVLHNASDPTLH